MGGPEGPPAGGSNLPDGVQRPPHQQGPGGGAAQCGPALGPPRQHQHACKSALLQRSQGSGQGRRLILIELLLLNMEVLLTFVKHRSGFAPGLRASVSDSRQQILCLFTAAGFQEFDLDLCFV